MRLFWGIENAHSGTTVSSMTPTSDEGKRGGTFSVRNGTLFGCCLWHLNTATYESRETSQNDTFFSVFYGDKACAVLFETGTAPWLLCSQERRGRRRKGWAGGGSTRDILEGDNEHGLSRFCLGLGFLERLRGFVGDFDGSSMVLG